MRGLVTLCQLMLHFYVNLWVKIVLQPVDFIMTVMSTYGLDDTHANLLISLFP